MNLEKTKIVYCKDENRKGTYENTKFDYLGYTFKIRGAVSNKWRIFNGFLPAMSDKAQKDIRKELRSYRIQRQVDKSITDIANMFNSKIQGWINYYSHYYKTEVKKILDYFNSILIKWVMRKFKRGVLNAKK